MAASSITKNFVVSGEKQVEKFANAIEESKKFPIKLDSSPKVRSIITINKNYKYRQGEGI